jgi:hypothetical protein
MPLPKHYLCYRAAHAFTLDGKLNKPIWQPAPWTDDFEDIEGPAKPRPRFRTRVKMLWDDTNLYIGAEMQEPHVWATLTEHDSVIFHDNDFEVFLDPDGDNHDYYEIEINALNTTWDLRLVKPYRDGGPALNEWEIPGFRSAVHVDGTLNDARDIDKEWSLEMALPWKALGEYDRRPAPPRDGDQWRINFSRVEWDIDIVDGKIRKVPDRPEYNWVWSPQGVIDMHRPEKWGYVQFSTAPPGTAKYVPDPAIPSRDLLMQIYYAQRAFRDKHKRWAAAWPELGLSLPPSLHLPTVPTIRLTSQGYTASCLLRLPNGKVQTWHVRDDSKLWAE